MQVILLLLIDKIPIKSCSLLLGSTLLRRSFFVFLFPNPFKRSLISMPKPSARFIAMGIVILILLLIILLIVPVDTLHLLASTALESPSWFIVSLIFSAITVRI